MNRRVHRRGLLALPFGAAACASPEPTFFTLAPVPGPTRASSAGRSIELRRIALAAYLDRASIVRATADFRLNVATDERWGEPLADMIARVTAANLTQRLPDTTIVQESATLSVESELVLELDVQRLDADATGRVVLVAQFVLRPRRAREASLARNFRTEVAPAAPGTAALAAAMSAALGQLADAIAAA